MKYDYDFVIIGGGAAGLSVASGAAQLGTKVCLISDAPLGGDCLFYGCVPSKALIKSAKVAQIFREAEKYGINAQKLKFDWEKITKRIKTIQNTIVDEVDNPERFRKMGVDVIFGRAEFSDPHTLKVQMNPEMADQQQPEFKEKKDWETTGNKIVIASGSRPNIPPIEGLRETGFVTNETIFTLPTQPKSLIILGAGPIGCELTQAFARLGTDVHLLYRKPHILDKEDVDVVEIVEKKFKMEGVNLYPETTMVRFEKRGDKKVFHIERNGTKEIIEADEILVSTGRKLNVDLGLDEAGIKYSPHGIETNAKLRTNVNHIIAIGDVNGKYLFTHTAGYEAGIVVSNEVLHFPKKVNYGLIPWATFIDPEVASCGLNEKAAQEKGIKYDVWKQEFKTQDRALTESENEGFVKILTTGRRGKIIGAQIIGPHAGELIHEFIITLNAGLTVATIASSVHVYPTLAEACKQAAGKFFTPKIFSTRTKKILKFLFRYRGEK